MLRADSKFSEFPAVRVWPLVFGRLDCFEFCLWLLICELIRADSWSAISIRFELRASGYSSLRLILAEFRSEPNWVDSTFLVPYFYFSRVSLAVFKIPLRPLEVPERDLCGFGLEDELFRVLKKLNTTPDLFSSSSGSCLYLLDLTSDPSDFIVGSLWNTGIECLTYLSLSS